MPQHFYRGYGGAWREHSQDRWKAGMDWAREKFPQVEADDSCAMRAFESVKDAVESGGPPRKNLDAVLHQIQLAYCSDPRIARAEFLIETAKRKGAKVDRKAPSRPAQFFDLFWEGVRDYAVTKMEEILEDDPDANMKSTQQLRRDLWKYAGLPGTWDDWSRDAAGTRSWNAWVDSLVRRFDLF
jgi:hypothetical protein